MATLVLVRHGQASLGAEDYDVLSPLGWRQGRALGNHWAGLDEPSGEILLGPRRRHRETWLGFNEGRGESSPELPAGSVLPSFDEHQAAEVVAHYRDNLEPDAPEDPAQRTRWYLQAFQRLTRQWVRGELATPPGLEPWPEFRRRIDGGLEALAERVQAGGRYVLFTSGGVMAAAVGRALELDDVKTMEISWRIRNASYSRFLISEGRFSLDTFNETPHLTDRELLTFV